MVLEEVQPETQRSNAEARLFHNSLTSRRTDMEEVRPDLLKCTRKGLRLGQHRERTYADNPRSDF